MNQADLRRLAEERIQDAKVLIDAGRWEFAYYAAGYAVECALKACILSRMIHTGWVFQDRVKKIEECRTHEFMKLIEIAGMKDELNSKLKQSEGNEFVTNWDTVKGWNVTSRYETRSGTDAKHLYAAITAEPHGVMTWIRNNW